MLEIIILIFLTKNIGTLAHDKGLKPTPWKVYTVLGWIGGEFLGAVLGYVLFDDSVAAIIMALVLAISSYFIVKTILSRQPDPFLIDAEIAAIGEPVEEA